MPGQTLTTNIVINARTGSGFSQVGATLQELGSLVNGFSQPLIEFGKESINVYREYEKSMKDAEVALSTEYGRDTAALSNVMKNLDDQATEWAATTIFHTNDVSNAISEAAHAGWDYEQIMYGLPAAMQLAQAGGLDLSEAVNYIVKSTNAAGIEFEDLTYFTDLWTFAANSSASTIGEFGEAMLRMGSTMRFASNPKELMTLMAVTANAGSVGSEAGTMIRNSFMRLIAPTDKASEAMAELGVTSDEAAALLNDESLAAASAELAARGFSAYDQQGKLRPILDIYRDMYEALGEIAGSYEDIDKNEDALSVLSAIFPTRTITEALNLLRAASSEYGGLYEAMMNGEAEGYGAYAAEKRMNTLDGRIEIFNSKVERLKQVVGEGLSDDVGSFLGGLGNVVDRVAELDEGKLGALISGGEILAGLGPGLIGVGGAIRLLGNLTPVGWMATAGIGMAVALSALQSIAEYDYEESFGTAEADLAKIRQHAQGIHSEFEESYKSINQFRDAVDKSISTYETASESFTGKLFTEMVSGATLSESDAEELYSLADEMYDAVQKGIANRAAQDESYWSMLFGNYGDENADDYLKEFTDSIEGSKEEAMASVRETGEALRNALSEALSNDGKISPDEYQDILSYVRDYYANLEKAKAEIEFEQSQKSLIKDLLASGGISYDSLTATEEIYEALKQNELNNSEDAYQSALANTIYDSYQNGEAIPQEALDAANKAHEQEQYAIEKPYNEAKARARLGSTAGGQDAEAYEVLSDLADRVIAGEIDLQNAYSQYNEQFGGWRAGLLGGRNSRMNRNLGEAISGQGGYEAIVENIETAMQNGDFEYAADLGKLFAMQQVLTNGGMTAEDGTYTSMASMGGLFADAISALNAEVYSAQIAKQEIGLSGETKSALFDYFEQVNSGIQAITGYTEATPQLAEVATKLSSSYDFERVLADTAGSANIKPGLEDAYAAWSLMYGPASMNAEDYRIKVIPEVDMSSLPELPPVPMPIEPYVEGEDAVESLRGQGVDVQVNGDVSQLTATIDKEDGKNLLEYIDGDATSLHYSIMDEDNQQLTENVNGDISALAAAINSQNGRTITVNIQGRRMFAEGGRATEASIFGEAGPEWAIPEAHTERTAELLNAARAASGFSWADLIARFGGLNANVNNSPSTFVYAPVINAQNAEGVERVLREDKERMENWWAEHQMREAMEVYA